MKLTFIGAAHEVTGSCSFLTVAGKNLLVDYGMEQGKDVFENVPLPVSPSEIDALFLTHAHIDHSGLLPLLYKGGFRGKIHTTGATKNLCEIMLLDSAHIQESDAAFQNKKNKRSGKPEVEPLYTAEDAENTLSLLAAHPYGERITVFDGVDVRFTDAGHLLGSASVELWLTENGETRKIVFSGDIGNVNQPLLRDPQTIDTADYAVIESTYGDRKHNPPPDYASALAEIIQRSLDRGGNVVIPSFAVGRTQEILYFIRIIKEKGLVHGHDGFPVYVDSPLATRATTVFVDNGDACYDEEARALLDAGVNPLDFPGLRVASSTEDSVALNTDAEPKVIISASGMCDAGRIRHHLKYNLWRPESTVLFVGYQSVGTLGRQIADGADKVRLFGEEIAVKAEVVTLAGISGHGDADELIRWIAALSPAPKTVFVNHGEDQVCADFANRITEEFGIPAMAPYSGTEYDLAAGELVRLTDPVRVRKVRPAEPEPSEAAAPAERQPMYEKLQKAFARLEALVASFADAPDQNVSALTNSIYSILDKWEKKKKQSERKNGKKTVKKKAKPSKKKGSSGVSRHQM